MADLKKMRPSALYGRSEIIDFITIPREFKYQHSLTIRSDILVSSCGIVCFNINKIVRLHISPKLNLAVDKTKLRVYRRAKRCALHAAYCNNSFVFVFM